MALRDGATLDAIMCALARPPHADEMLDVRRRDVIDGLQFQSNRVAVRSGYLDCAQTVEVVVFAGGLGAHVPVCDVSEG